MATANNPDDPGAGLEIQLSAPQGDHPLTAEHLVQTTIALLTGALTELTEVLEIHADMAPESTIRITDLATTIATVTADWLKRWPRP